MFGLIYRDIVINKKSIFAGFLMVLFMFKTLIDVKITNEMEVFLWLNIYTFVEVVMTYAISDYAINTKERKKWSLFLKATSISQKVVIGERYLFDYIFVCFSSFLAVLLMCVYCVKIDTKITVDAFTGITCAIVLILLHNAVNRILVEIIGVKWTNFAIVVFLVISIALLIKSAIESGVNFSFVGTGEINYLSIKAIGVLLSVSVFIHSCSYYILVLISDCK